MKKIISLFFFILPAFLLYPNTPNNREFDKEVPVSSRSLGVGTLPTKPNIVVILTDQERFPTHWPVGWVEENLPSTVRLQKNGLTFNKAYTSASECSPSRAVLLSGQYYPTNETPTTAPLANGGFPPAVDLPNLASLLTNLAGYEVVWKGKWHLSYPVDGDNNWSPLDIPNLNTTYDFAEWNPPDAGNLIDIPFYFSLGGANANNDGRYIHGVTKGDNVQTPGYGYSLIDYIEKKGITAKHQEKPFCLFVSLVNPHDIWTYPTNWQAAGYLREKFANMGISLPRNYNDDLSTKPSIQQIYYDEFALLFPLPYPQSLLEYVNFYAYLHTVVDQHITEVLNALERAGLMENTIIFRTADHGELGLSHGLRQKAYSAYEEMIHVPLIVSNPTLYSSPLTTHSFYTHVDLLPTILDIAGIQNPNTYGKGFSIVPILEDPTATVRDSVLFAYDDVVPGISPTIPGGHVRAIRTGNWLYAVYFAIGSPDFQYEMYDLNADPGELDNLLFGVVSTPFRDQAHLLDDQLKALLDYNMSIPPGVIWPSNPW